MAHFVAHDLIIYTFENIVQETRLFILLLFTNKLK